MSPSPSQVERPPKKKLPPRIGWREWVSLPELGIARIKVKVDTGARSSALHALEVMPIQREGSPWVRFRVQPLQRSKAQSVLVEAPLVGKRWVRSSCGKRTLRPVVRTLVALRGKTWPVEVTLVRRDLMGFRMLLGRQAIRARFLVHPGRSFLAGQPSSGGDGTS